jgi:hypothetical protein
MNPANTSSAVPEYLSPLRETLLIQCHPSQTLRAAALADRDNAGLVITPKLGLGKPEAARAQAYGAALHLRQKGQFGRPILLDASRYTGKNRVPASEDFDTKWIERQRDLNLTILTDSGYVAEGDAAGVESILQRTAGLGNAIALLPLHNSWLRDRRAVDTLISAIARANVPVALILEHSDDPFELVGVATAFLQVVSAGPPVLLLRCDISALGALSVGALAAAVGTGTSLRHLYPQKNRGGGGGRKPMIAAVIQECMSYLSLDKITLASQADPDDSLWNCDCDACHRVSIRELSIQPFERKEELAFVHSIEALMTLRDRLLKPGSTRAQRAVSWRVSCQNAQFRHMEVESVTDKFPPPAFLRRWQEALAGVPLQERVR